MVPTEVLFRQAVRLTLNEILPTSQGHMGELRSGTTAAVAEQECGASGESCEETCTM